MSGKEKLRIVRINITSILNNFKSLITKVYEKGCTHKFNKKIDQNIYFRANLAQR